MEDKDYDIKKVKNSLVFYKKYFKFYKNKFIPITKFEESDRVRKLRNFESLRIFSFAFGCLALNSFLKLKNVLNTKETVVYTTIKSRNMRENLTQTLSFGLLGFIIGHCFGLKLTYDQTEYVRLRAFYEKSINYERTQGTLFADYPFADRAPYLKSDLAVKHKYVDPKLIKSKKDKIHELEPDAILDNRLKSSLIDVKGFLTDSTKLENDDLKLN